MNLDIAIKISNYIANDLYTINIYRQGSAIAVKTVEHPRNGGTNIDIKDLPGGFMYDAEVIHHCTGGESSSKKISVSAVGAKVCNCPTGYTANTDKTKCVRTTTVLPTVVGTTEYTVGVGPNEASYSSGGASVYAPGYDTKGEGAKVWESGGNNTYWASQGILTQGRLNNVGIWNAASASLPLATWIGFSAKITVLVSKVYYVAMAGDNYIRFSVNGQLIVDQRLRSGSTAINFTTWHIYPVFLNAGEAFLEMQGYNNEGSGCFGAEIYNCDLNALQLVTTATESTLNKIFTTANQTTFTKDHVCPAGYALDISVPDSPMCKKIEYEACGS